MPTPTSLRIKARIAGLLYLAVVLTGIFSLMYVPSKLVEINNAAATFQHISSSQLLFRLGIVSSLLCYTCFILLPVALYELLNHVHAKYAKVMVLLAVTSVPIAFVNVQHKFSVLTLVSGSEYLHTFSREQLQAMVMFHLDQYDAGIRIVSIFWGLWLLPLGYLVFKSGFLPKVLGVLLMLGCVGYLINFLGNFLIPDYSAAGVSTFIRLPATLGEIGTCLWLLVSGVKDKQIDG